jgi:hypothetical protein
MKTFSVLERKFLENFFSFKKKRGTVCPKTKTQILSIGQGQPKLATPQMQIMSHGMTLGKYIFMFRRTVVPSKRT